MGQRGGVAVAAGSMLGAGAVVVFPAAVAETGWWSLVSLVMTAVVAALTAVSFATLQAHSPSNGMYSQVKGCLGEVPGRLAAVSGLAGRVVAGAAVAGAAGMLVLPGQPLVAAVALIVLAAAWIFADTRVPVALCVVVMITLLLFVVVGLGISPEAPAVIRSGGVGSDDLTGLLSAAGLLLVGFVGFERVRESSRAGLGVITAVAVVYLLVGFVALRHLGGPRLALSPTPLHDALVAADAGALAPILTAGLVVGAVLALRGLLDGACSIARDMADSGELPQVVGHHRLVLVGAATAATALVLTPASALGLASCLLLGSFAFVNSAARSLSKAQRSTWVCTGCCGLALCVVVAVNISVTALAGAVGVLLVGAGLCAWVARRARSVTAG